MSGLDKYATNPIFVIGYMYECMTILYCWESGNNCVCDPK